MNYFILSLLIICLLYLFLFKSNLIEGNEITIYSDDTEAEKPCVDENNNVNSTIIEGAKYAISKLSYNNKVQEYENTIREYPGSCFSKGFVNAYNNLKISHPILR